VVITGHDRDELGALVFPNLSIWRASGSEALRARLQETFDRLSRDTTDLLVIAREMQRAGAGIRSLAEPFLDTTSDFAEIIFAILGVAAKLERRRILEHRPRDEPFSAQVGERNAAYGRINSRSLATDRKFRSSSASGDTSSPRALALPKAVRKLARTSASAVGVLGSSLSLFRWAPRADQRVSWTSSLTVFFSCRDPFHPRS